MDEEMDSRIIELIKDDREWGYSTSKTMTDKQLKLDYRLTGAQSFV
jgi:hypothetical protein